MAIKKSNMTALYKYGLILTILLYFAVGYFISAALAVHTTRTANTFLDDAIPFMPGFMFFYICGYFIVPLALFLKNKKKDLNALIYSFFVVMTISFIIFSVFSIKIIKPIPTGTDISSKLLVYQQAIDSPYNTFPSLHVSLGILSLFSISYDNKRLAKYLFPIVILMICSTLTLKQHYIIDVIGGSMMALLGCWLYRKKAELYKK